MTCTSLSRYWLLVGLTLLGFAARLAVAFFLGISEPPRQGSDSEEYDTYAWNVVQGRGYRGMSPDVTDQDHLTAYRPPGTSLIWAGLFSVFGHRYDVIRILNCLLGAATIPLVHAIALRCFGTSVAMISAAVYTVWPLALFFSSTLMSEAPGTLFFLGSLLACLVFAEETKWWSAVAGGVLLGLTLLTRPNPIPMIPLTAVWAGWQFRRNPKALKRGLAIPLFTMLTMTPWWVRNAMVFGSFIPISTMGGSVLLQGNNRIVATDPDLYGSEYWDSRIPEYHDALLAPNDEVERDRVAGRFAVEWLMANRDLWPTLVWNKLLRGWTPFLQERSPRLFKLGLALSWGPVLLLFLIGVIPTALHFLRKGHPGWILHMALVSGLAMNIMMFGDQRYRYTIDPICIMIAVWTALRGVEFFRTRRGQGPAVQSLV